MPLLPMGPPIIVETQMGVKKKGRGSKKRGRRSLAERIAAAVENKEKEDLLKKLVRKRSREVAMETEDDVEVEDKPRKKPKIEARSKSTEDKVPNKPKSSRRLTLEAPEPPRKRRTSVTKEKDQSPVKISSKTPTKIPSKSPTKSLSKIPSKSPIKGKIFYDFLSSFK
jgi:hypothetical protein